MSEKVLVTGACGYIGSILCEHLLDAEYQVTAVDNLMYENASLFHLCAEDDFHFVRGDVRDRGLMGDIVGGHDVIVPLAALVGAPACKRDPAYARSVNLEAIRMLYQVRNPEQLVVFPTTNSGYGSKSGETYCTEETPLEPISLYGKTKVKAEEELLESPNTITLRLATVFGMSPRMRVDLLVNDFVHEAVERRYIVVYEKDYKRDYIHIRDVADCIIHCIESADEMVGRAYNVGLDEANLSKQELAEKVKEHVGRFEIVYSDIYSDPDKRNYIVSNERLREAGFTATRTLDQGIEELIKGYRMTPDGRYRNA
jgi:nucleoside-diphosphate-sugar epimerase